MLLATKPARLLGIIFALIISLSGDEVGARDTILKSRAEYMDPTATAVIEQIEGGRSIDQNVVSAGEQKDFCWKYGCLVFANQSSDIQLTAFAIANRVDAHNNPIWERPFVKELPIRPHQGWWVYRAGPQVCEVLIDATAVNIHTGEQFQERRRYDFCKGPSSPNLVIRIHDPEDAAPSTTKPKP